MTGTVHGLALIGSSYHEYKRTGEMFYWCDPFIMEYSTKLNKWFDNAKRFHVNRLNDWEAHIHKPYQLMHIFASTNLNFIDEWKEHVSSRRNKYKDMNLKELIEAIYDEDQRYLRNKGEYGFGGDWWKDGSSRFFLD